MEDENEAILIAMLIGAVILGIGLAMFLNRPFAGYGAVVLAIGLMTLSLIITMRAEEIIHLKIYPTPARPEAIAEVSVETASPKEPISAPSIETQAREASESEEPFEVQFERAPEEQGIEEAQQVQEAQETEESYTPNMYEPEPQQESTFGETEQEQETSVETSQFSSEQS